MSEAVQQTPATQVVVARGSAAPVVRVVTAQRLVVARQSAPMVMAAQRRGTAVLAVQRASQVVISIGGGAPMSGYALDTTLQQLRDLAARDTTLTAGISALLAALAPLATQATVATLNGKDFATQTTLAALLTRANLLGTQSTLGTRASEATLATLVAKDFATQTTLAEIKTLVTALGAEATLQQVRDRLPDGRSLTSRMLSKQPLESYALWVDAQDAQYVYLLEAPTAAAATDTGFRGIRATMVGGEVLGKVQINNGGTLTFNNRATDGGWA